MAAQTATVIVVSYKDHPWLEPCLASVVGQADEVVVVDNGSPGSVASATARRLGATALRLPENTGFAGGVNAGLSAAHGRLVGLLNDDAVAGPGWIESAARVLADRSVAAVGPKMVLPGRYGEVRLTDPAFHAAGDPRPLGRMIRTATVDGEDVLGRLVGDLHGPEHGVLDGQPATWRWTRGPGSIFVPVPDSAGDQDGAGDNVFELDHQKMRLGPPVSLLNSAGTAITEEGEAQDYGSERPDDGRFDVAEERFSACGGAMVMRADTLAHLGRFAGHFFAYYEDLDWCWRARLAGYRIMYDPLATVTHIRWATSGGPAGDAIWPLVKRNRILTLVRNGPPAVAAHQLRRTWSNNWPPGIRRDLAATVPAALAQRRKLARRWVRSPDDVWREWAGRDGR
jgi:GT2 family glycosyltransferase